MIYAPIGRRGQGKSTLGRFIASCNGARVIIDPKFDMANPNAAIVARVNDIEPAIAELERPDRRFDEVVIQPRHMRAAFVATTAALDQWRERDRLARWTLMLDEWKIIQNSLRDTVADLEPLEYLVRTSTIDRQHIVITCHRPVDMHPNVRALVDHWLLFRMTEARDVKAIGELSTRAAIRVRRIGEREYVHLDARRNESTDRGDENPSTFSRADAWHVCLRCGHPHGQARAGCRCACHPGASVRLPGPMIELQPKSADEPAQIDT